MKNSEISYIDHEEYARLGRQLQAQEARILFSAVVSGIKKYFSEKTGLHGQDLATGQKC